MTYSIFTLHLLTRAIRYVNTEAELAPGSRPAGRTAEKHGALALVLTNLQQKLGRAADCGLAPDLNVGIVLTIAALHNLKHLKEATVYWKDLHSGKYPWSSVAQQLAAQDPKA